MKIAVLLNEQAGGGLPRQRLVMEKLKEQWLGQRLYGVKGFGGEYLSGRALPSPSEALGYLPRMEAALKELLAEGPDLILSVGGDGTAAYLAEMLIRCGSQIPLAGLGSGTANVGPIVSMSLAQKLPPPQEMEEARLGAIEALGEQGQHIAYGFNDLVLGNTYLGTREGHTVTFSAAALLKKALKETAAPEREMLTEDARWFLDGKEIDPPYFRPAQLIASPEERDIHYGRAIGGALMYTCDSPYRGVVYISDHPLVSMEESEAGFGQFLKGAQLLLKEESRLTIRGLKEDICAVADGNPYAIPGGVVQLQYVPECIRVLRRR